LDVQPLEFFEGEHAHDGVGVGERDCFGLASRVEFCVRRLELLPRCSERCFGSLEIAATLGQRANGGLEIRVLRSDGGHRISLPIRPETDASIFSTRSTSARNRFANASGLLLISTTSSSIARSSAACWTCSALGSQRAHSPSQLDSGMYRPQPWHTSLPSAKTSSWRRTDM